ncbi:unnamed protein product [Acanthoscelides obtectus]|uniref:BTB domain-containing protein n=1 Tax=Acanthoscelides obtectus TaxID=200917 RepID=A0A9P0PW58_ACAOB|nr:unnamed protein product [Acanthoscelides obtectus]CAK1637645.1 TD and POZ domain-containing protein 4 [Acanthoscelides obtectus]
MDDSSDEMNRRQSNGKDYRQTALSKFFTEEKFTDCTFVFENGEVKAHKIILACNSPVFESMLYGVMGQSTIKIKDLNMVYFKEVIKFIYTDEVDISSQEHAWELYSIASIYLIDDLLEFCLDYIYENLAISNLLLSYEYTDMYNITWLKDHCMEDIVEYALGVFENMNYHMKPSTMERVCDRLGYVDIKFNPIPLIFKWAVDELKSSEDPDVKVTAESVLSLLETHGILKCICHTWWIKPCYKCMNLLCTCSRDTVYEDFFLSLGGKIRLTQEDSIINEAKCISYLHSVVQPHGEASCQMRRVYKVSQRIDLVENEAYVSSVSATGGPVMIFGIQIDCGTQPTNPHTDPRIKGIVTVRLCLEGTTQDVGPPTSKELHFFHNSSVYVAFNCPFLLEENKVYDFRISFSTRASGGGLSVICHFRSNQLRHVRSLRALTFYDPCGSPIKGVSLYPV